MLFIWLGKFECFVVIIKLLCVLCVIFGVILGFGFEYVNIIGLFVISLRLLVVNRLGLDIFINILVLVIMFCNVCLLVLLVNNCLYLFKLLWWVWIIFLWLSI